MRLTFRSEFSNIAHFALQMIPDVNAIVPFPYGQFFFINAYNSEQGRGNIYI